MSETVYEVDQVDKPHKPYQPHQPINAQNFAMQTMEGMHAEIALAIPDNRTGFYTTEYFSLQWNEEQRLINFWKFSKRVFPKNVQ